MRFSSSAVSRRTFLKLMASGATVSLAVTSLPAFALNAFAQTTDDFPAWAPEPGKAKWRIDGMAKVLGQKLYARDFKSRDFQGWPKEENWLYALRCDCHDRVVTGYDLSMLPAGLKPIAVVDDKALTNKNMKTASEMDPGSRFFAQLGQPAECFGQPVAMLIFANFDVYRRAVKILQFNDNVIKYGARIEQTNTAYSPATSYVRDDSQNFNYVYSSNYNNRQAAVAQDVRASMASAPWLKLHQDFYTQTIDPVFMEPESGLAWYDPATQQLQLVLGTQSPMGDINAAASIFDGSAYPLKSVEMLSCYPGGGFGGRDESYFSMYIAVAAPFAKAPVRWAQTRFEQFQVGLKRCETEFTETLAIDKDGHIQAIDCNFVMNGGGQKNLSPYVAQLAALSAMSCYNIPRAIATGVSTHTPQLFGGSQRGFGGPQAFMAIETLLDEAAQSLHMDPFTLRRKNLLTRQSGATVTGAPVLQDLQLDEILNRLERHPLWQERVATQKARAQQGLKYGVGFAMSNEAYGTSGDGMFGAVQINADGSITALTPYVDMGNGAATALGLAPAKFLGRNVSTIAMGETQVFDSLGLTTPTTSPTIPTPPTQVLKGSGSASACMGAFYQFHVVEGAASVLLLQSVLPAANALWGTAQKASDIRWVKGVLTANGLAALPWRALVDKMMSMGLPTFAVVHASFVGEFATAQYSFNSGMATVPLDYIATGANATGLQTLPRSNLVNPPAINARFGRTTYAPSASLVAASIDPQTGKVSIEHVVTALSAGVQHCPELVSGQSQGAVAMAIGNVLSEDCPNSNEGPGNGKWNLDRYAITPSADIPRQELVVLPPAAGETTARGIAEAVMCPIAPAILNALAMATGKRFTRTPVTATIIREALS